MLSVVSVEEYNRRVADALDRAQRALRVRSAEAFARAMADRTGGSPAGSTYRRWIDGGQVVPGWALVVAAELAGQTVDALLGSAPAARESGSGLTDELAELRRQVEGLQRQVADLQVEAMDRESAQPTTDQHEADRTQRHARGA